MTSAGTALAGTATGTFDPTQAATIFGGGLLTALILAIQKWASTDSSSETTPSEG